MNTIPRMSAETMTPLEPTAEVTTVQTEAWLKSSASQTTEHQLKALSHVLHVKTQSTDQIKQSTGQLGRDLNLRAEDEAASVIAAALQGVALCQEGVQAGAGALMVQIPIRVGTGGEMALKVAWQMGVEGEEGDLYPEAALVVLTGLGVALRVLVAGWRAAVLIIRLEAGDPFRSGVVEAEQVRMLTPIHSDPPVLALALALPDLVSDLRVTVLLDGVAASRVHCV